MIQTSSYKNYAKLFFQYCLSICILNEGQIIWYTLGSDIRKWMVTSQVIVIIQIIQKQDRTWCKALEIGLRSSLTLSPFRIRKHNRDFRPKTSSCQDYSNQGQDDSCNHIICLISLAKMSKLRKSTTMTKGISSHNDDQHLFTPRRVSNH